MDEDHQDVVMEEPRSGEFFGFALMLDGTPHHSLDAMASEPTTCLEIDREDILALVRQKPHAGLICSTAVGRRLHAAHAMVRERSARNPTR